MVEESECSRCEKDVGNTLHLIRDRSIGVLDAIRERIVEPSGLEGISYCEPLLTQINPRPCEGCARFLFDTLQEPEVCPVCSAPHPVSGDEDG